MIFTAIMLWAYRLFLRKWANSFQTKTLVKLENWYERQLRGALSGRRPYILSIGTFLLLIAAFMAFGVSLAPNEQKLNFFQTINQIKLLFI